MKVLRIYVVLVFLVVENQSRVVTPHQNCRNNVCYFDFVVDYKFTMMWYNYTKFDDPQFQPVVFKDGVLQRRVTNVVCREQFIPLTREAHVWNVVIQGKKKMMNHFWYYLISYQDLIELRDDVSTGDGRYKLVYAINGEIPSPNIVVFEDQIVSVNVYNKLEVEGLAIHWHGMLHRGTPWMDGSSMISHCPILPGQTFEYRFVASPVGSHWYHGHVHSLRSDGLAGAFIVLPRIRPPLVMPSEIIPAVEAEFTAVLVDWLRTSAIEKLQAVRGEFAFFDEYDSQCVPLPTNYDGSTFFTPLNIGLVNGKGQKFINGNPNLPEREYLPLETFRVRPNRYYRFRTINAGFNIAFEISVDDHMLIIVAFDGNDVEPYKTDIVVLQPGERVDFIIFTNRPIDNYRVNIFSTATSVGRQPVPFRDRTYAILNYQGVEETRIPIIRQRDCTQTIPCLAVNQIFGLYPAGVNIIGIPLTRLRSTQWTLKKTPVPIVQPGRRKQLFFLNFNVEPGRGAQINGIQFARPTSALQFCTYPGPGATTPCGPDTCTGTRCSCTHTLKLDLGNVIEMVIFSFGDIIKSTHPAHLHGHQFHVLKIGYPPFDSITGNSTGFNPDIRCLNEDCSRGTWADPTWINGPIPGVNLVDPPLKDVVNIPANGYVIIRFMADNPGFWFLHCHFAHHFFGGMSLVMEEGEIQDMPPVPPNFPTCNKFRFNPYQFDQSLRNHERTLALKGISPSFTSGVTFADPRHAAKTCLQFPWICRKPLYS